MYHVYPKKEPYMNLIMYPMLRNMQKVLVVANMNL